MLVDSTPLCLRTKVGPLCSKTRLCLIPRESNYCMTLREEMVNTWFSPISLGTASMYRQVLRTHTQMILAGRILGKRGTKEKNR